MFTLRPETMQMDNEMSRWEQRHGNYRKALARLAAIVRIAAERKLDEFECDSMVKRFEFTFECAWRVMKSYAEAQGIGEVGASRDSIRHAYQLHIIDDASTWMDMIKWRNETSHNYDGEVASEALLMIQQTFYPLMVQFCDVMDSKSSHQPLPLFQ